MGVDAELPAEGRRWRRRAAQGGNGERHFRGEKRSNDTHASTTDGEARLCKKASGEAAKLAFMGHVLMENRSCLVIAARLTHAPGTAEREAALAMVADIPGRHRITPGADRGDDATSLVDAWRALGVTPHVAQNTSGRRSAVDGRTTRHAGYWASQILRKRIEAVVGGGKTVAPMRQTRHRGLARVGWPFTLTAAADNLLRIPKRLAA